MLHVLSSFPFLCPSHLNLSELFFPSDFVFAEKGQGSLNGASEADVNVPECVCAPERGERAF